MAFDSHAHLDDERFGPDIEEIVLQMKRQDIAALVPGVDVAGVSNVLKLVEPWDHLVMAVGIHPSEIDQAERLTELEAYLDHPKVVAIGEIGLDYYWVKDNKDSQQELFRKQLQLAKTHQLPVIIHDREAHEDIFRILKQEDMFPTGVIMHAFSGSAEMAREYVKLGAMISLAGPVTFKNARVPKEVAAEVPLDHLLVETDSPYLTPHPLRGKRNDPRLLHLIIEEIAQIKGLSPETVEQATTDNAKRIFQL